MDALWNNQQTNVAVWGDDLSNDRPEKNGFGTGEEITWLATYDDGVTTYEATVEYQMGGNSYSTNGVNIISLLTISNTILCK